MADRTAPGPADNKACIREAVCVNTRKIFDSCKDKDCIEDLRVYPTSSSQAYIDKALSIRPKTAELLYVDVRVQPVGFNRGYYTVDCSYFYKLIAETFPGGELCQGLAIFDKRVMLFGSEGTVRCFSSLQQPCESCDTGDLPVAVVNSVDPIALSTKLCEPGCCPCCDAAPRDIPACISSAFPEPLVLDDSVRRWYATLGQFSIVRLERPTQLLIPAYDYCLPEKDCPGSSEDDPCELFSRIRFPVEEFFPPDDVCAREDYKGLVK